jgi:hypothetical protein
MRVAAAVIVMLIVQVPFGSGVAASYPWCAQYNNLMLGRRCTFSTLQQCQDSVSGVGGFCDSNPWYVPPKAKSRSRKKRKPAARTPG